ncbi:F-box protein At5g07610-like [Rutidosis leptorrhynchoides]|uniref:F-box protein At5g07610-like n=1 Tax=Rutidosis leptorrhynchoides TaxID=125765 RepID=UPI003A98DE35
MTTNNTKRIRVNKSDVVSVITLPNNQSSSPLHAADKIGSCNDLITQIMLRLPVISLLQFKSVSKHWYSLISDLTFKQLLQNRTSDPPSGLYAITKTNPHKLDYYFIPFDVENRPKAPNITLNFAPDDKGTTCIVQSCNGLMLCCRHYDYKLGFMFINRYVYNPTINQFTTLPKQGTFNKNYRCSMTLVFDPSKSPYYKIVSVRRFCTNYSIGIYSSQTCTWKASCRCDLAYDLDSSPGVYWNNAVHWLFREYRLLYFSLEKEVVRIIPTPFRFASSNEMFESRDHLLVVESGYDTSSKLKIYELNRDYSKWIVKYHVDLHQLGSSFPEAVDSGVTRFRVLCVVLGEKEEDESFFVLAIAGVAVRFNLSFVTARALQVIGALFWLVVITVIDVLFYIFEHGYSVLKAAFCNKRIR